MSDQQAMRATDGVRLYPASVLTARQVFTLAARLAGTEDNVFTLGRGLFRIDLDESIFGRLRRDAGVFRCEECGVWRRLLDQPALTRGGDVCWPCQEEINDAMS